MIHFEIPKNQSSIIKVIGVGGGGGNAVNYMYNLGIDGVDFVVCNTDSQALAQSPIPNKIQLGPHLTQGLGAGANPEIGKQAGEESVEDIAKVLNVNTRMAFITAGMGGGTGTGSAPVISKVCRDLGILTVGIVTTPFTYEGRKRMKQAQDGIAQMREHVDTILIISNDKLRQQFGNLPFTQAFAKADNILSTAAKCITDLITVDGRVNLDFNDVQTVMKNGGVAILGSAQAAGEDRAKTAVVEALSSPLLNDSEISGAKWILLNVTSAQGSSEHTLDELDIIQGYVQQQAGNTCDIILGMGHDPNLGENIAVTIIATGFQQNEIKPSFPLNAQERPQEEKVYVNLGNQATPTTSAATFSNPVATPQTNTNPSASFNNVPPTVTPTATSVNNNIINPEPVQQQAPNNFYQQQVPTPTHHVEPQPQAFELVIKEEPQEKMNFGGNFYGNQFQTQAANPMHQAELEEKMRLEEQTRLLEERAERLKKMSYNFGDMNANEIETVPAFVRRSSNLITNNPLENETPQQQPENENKSFLSGYSVEDKEGKANINTLNSYLNGKPD